MRRLTTDKPVKEMSNLELAYNCCIAENGEAIYRDFESPINARELALKLLDAFGIEGFCIETRADLDEFMLEGLLDGPFTSSGLIALLYRFIWSVADLRERLKAYEDTGLDPEQIYEMDRIYTEKCRELAKAKKQIEQEIDESINTIKEICDKCDPNGWCGACKVDEIIEALEKKR